MHTNVILTDKRRTHAQSNYTNTKLKCQFNCVARTVESKQTELNCNNNNNNNNYKRLSVVSFLGTFPSE